MERLWPRSLTARLVVTAVALVAVVSLLVGTVTTLGMRAWLTNRLDADVMQSIDPRGASGPMGRGPVGAPGTLEATFVNGVQQGSVVAATSAGAVLRPIDDDVLSVLGGATSEPSTVELPGLGSYRVVTLRISDGVRVVAGLPTDDVDEATQSLIHLEIVLALLGIVVAGLVGTAVVRRQLRPLTEVAATAHAVAELPLAEGEIGVTERVPERLTDPRTEAGQVGLALNQLLAHVESSLSARHRSEQQGAVVPS